ncbi:unnamed protein product [Adineta steineri]|uniref:G-protein coupled receptors family 1 profile domain-containing protein n=1 Tax=Adineta steineri TaxID=433720 RepID=A0A819BBA4_9BILA|nr:unnamed protein product [Adineta steineri]
MLNQTGFVLNIVTLSIDVFAYLYSLFILICLIYNIYSKRIKQEDKITIVYCINIDLVILIYTGITIYFNIETLLGDLYGYNFNSSWCMFLGYFSPVILATLYWSFVDQAFFRLCRIVYSTKRFFQHLYLYVSIFPIQFILICLLTSPIYFWHDVEYLTTEYYCYVPYINYRSIIWLAFICYGIPIIFIALMYLHITIFLRRQTNNQRLLIKQRQDRDLCVIRRIVITICLLLALGIPAIILLIMLFITGEEYPLLMRIEWFFVSLSMFGLTLFTSVFTPQLKNIIFKIFQHNRITIRDEGVPGLIPMR